MTADVKVETVVQSVEALLALVRELARQRIPFEVEPDMTLCPGCLGTCAWRVTRTERA